MTRHSTLLSATALYQVFIQPWLHNTVLARNAIQHATRTTLQRAPLLQHANYSRKPAAAPQIRNEKWNDEITADLIVLVDPETEKLQPPVRRRDVMATLNTTTHRLVQLVADEPGNRFFKPVCKIVNKKEAYEAQKKRKAQNKEANKARATEMSLKTLELNWAIDPNDLHHRLSRLQGFLEEGRKVEVVLASKKRGRRATLEECDELLSKIRNAVKDIKGVREPRPMEGKIGGVAMLAFQGTVVPSNAAPASIAESQAPT